MHTLNVCVYGDTTAINVQSIFITPKVRSCPFASDPHPSVSNNLWSVSCHYWLACFSEIYIKAPGAEDDSVDKNLAVPNIRNWVWILTTHIKVTVLEKQQQEHSWDLLAIQPDLLKERPCLKIYHGEATEEETGHKSLASTHMHTCIQIFKHIKPSYILLSGVWILWLCLTYSFCSVPIFAFFH